MWPSSVKGTLEEKFLQIPILEYSESHSPFGPSWVSSSVNHQAPRFVERKKWETPRKTCFTHSPARNTWALPTPEGCCPISSGLPHQPEGKHNPAQGHSQCPRKENKFTISTLNLRCANRWASHANTVCKLRWSEFWTLKSQKGPVGESWSPTPPLLQAGSTPLRTAQELRGRGTARRCYHIP